jgi:S-adenosylmethionine synthetase
MNINILNDLRDPKEEQFEVVERKGRGHPDTLSDRLAELLSRTYSKYTLEHHGAVLRHQFDKLSLMGGKAEVRFGSGNFRSPIRLLINGRVTSKVGDEDLFFRDLLIKTAKQFLEKELRNFDFTIDCRVIMETTSNRTRGMSDQNKKGSSPINFRFNPRSLKDIPEASRPLSNDTAVGCGWAPYTDLERLILEVEDSLTSDVAREKYPWLGSDVKIMTSRIKDKVNFTIACPQVCTLVDSADQYKENSKVIRSIIDDVVKKYSMFSEVSIHLNTGDDHEHEMFYLLYTGSCIESGDEGQVSRGNRLGGVISSRRPFSIEGLSGKNPSYHAGKIYSVAALDIANRIWKELGVPSEVFITSQIDRPLDDPWTVIINSTDIIDNAKAESIARDVLSNLPQVTNNLLEGKYPLV